LLSAHAYRGLLDEALMRSKKSSIAQNCGGRPSPRGRRRRAGPTRGPENGRSMVVDSGPPQFRIAAHIRGISDHDRPPRLRRRSIRDVSRVSCRTNPQGRSPGSKSPALPGDIYCAQDVIVTGNAVTGNVDAALAVQQLSRTSLHRNRFRGQSYRWPLAARAQQSAMPVIGHRVATVSSARGVIPPRL
jgi:hypothetical protein